MEKKKRDIINLLGACFIAVFFFLLCATYADLPVRQVNNTSEYDFTASIHSGCTKAIVADVTSWIVFKSCNFRLLNIFFNTNCFIRAFDNKISQRFRLLQKTHFYIKPFIRSHFYYWLFANDGEDVPILS